MLFLLTEGGDSYIRWLGAFRKFNSVGLFESIGYELQRTTSVACEQLKHGESSIRHARVGMLVDPSAVYKRFKADVWSEYEEGELRYTRKEYRAHSEHKESWAKPVYTGIVIKNGSLETLRYTAREELKKANEQFGIPVYKLVKGKLVLVLP